MSVAQALAIAAAAWMLVLDVDHIGAQADAVLNRVAAETSVVIAAVRDQLERRLGDSCVDALDA